MKKKYILLMAMFFVTIVAGASIVSISLSNASYDFSKDSPTEPTVDIITFSCDGKSVSVNSTEPNGQYDSGDMKTLTRQACSGVVTNIQKDGQTWRRNKYGAESFNEDALKKDECYRDGNNWTGTQCLTIDVEIGELG